MRGGGELAQADHSALSLHCWAGKSHVLLLEGKGDPATLDSQWVPPSLRSGPELPQMGQHIRAKVRLSSRNGTQVETPSSLLAS